MQPRILLGTENYIILVTSPVFMALFLIFAQATGPEGPEFSTSRMACGIAHFATAPQIGYKIPIPIY